MSDRLDAFADIYYGKSPAGVLSEEGNVPVVGTGGVYATASKAMFSGPAVVVPRKGSLGRPHLVTGPFWPSDTTFAVLPKPGVNAHWLFLQLSMFNLEKLNEATGVPSIGRDWLSKIKFLRQSERDQLEIAQVIAGIDSQIDQTEALIAKQEQVRAGLMQDLFTRGVDTSGRLRPPREEAPELYHETALGWLPKGWDSPLLDDVCRRASGHTPSRRNPEYWNGGIKWLSLADSYRLDQLYVHETEYEISEKGIQNSSAVLHPAGTVALSRDAGVGKSGILAVPMAVSQHFMAWICDARLDNRFLYYSLQHRKREFESIALGSTILTIGLSFFKRMRIARPSLHDEQVRIAECMVTVDSGIDNLRQEHEKLVRRRAGLMQDLLTGKVPVDVLLNKRAAA